MKVLIVSRFDYAGSGLGIRNAAQSVGIEAKLYITKPHRFGYEFDGIISRDNEEFMDFALQCDLIHFKGDDLLTHPDFSALDGIEKPRIITVGGSGFRRKSTPELDMVSIALHPIEEYVNQFDMVTALTADLCYPEFGIKLLPHCYTGNQTPEVKSKTLTVGHSPSSRAVKGTNEYFLPAMKVVQSRVPGSSVSMIEGMSHEKCVFEKSQCSLFFDQAIVPFYGMSAVEAMSYGIPVVTRISDECKRADEVLECSPVLSFDSPSVKRIADIIEDGFTNQEYQSKKTAEYFDLVHSKNAVGSRLIKYYSRLI